MDKIVLVIGRFQPFHTGHFNLIKRYHDAGFFIKIGIGSTQKKEDKDNPLTFKERKEIIKNALKECRIKKFKIYNLPDINKNYNYVKYVLKIVGKFETIVTGNLKVLKLFREYKCKNCWNIESFEEKLGRPGGKITSGIIRNNWLKRSNKKGLLKSTFDYLKSINFSERLRGLKSKGR